MITADYGFWGISSIFFLKITPPMDHDVHHQLYGSKYNFSRPFFVLWDRILGTYMPYSIEKRVGGGFEARPTKDCKRQ
jgi:sterol desaturase/sphingolipid hydroxylase (fatty acid hydroxylase superfamily)